MTKIREAMELQPYLTSQGVENQKSTLNDHKTIKFMIKLYDVISLVSGFLGEFQSTLSRSYIVFTLVIVDLTKDKNVLILSSR